MTRRQLSRHKRDLLLQRYLKIGFGALLGLAVLVIAFGYWHEEIAPGGEAIVRVAGVPISTQTYAKELGFHQYMTDLQIARMQAYAQQQSGAGQDDSANFLQQLIQQQLSQLQQQRATLEQQLIPNMIDDELVRQEAAKRGISVTPQEIDDEIVKQNSPASPATTPELATGQAESSAEAAPQQEGQGTPATTPSANPTAAPTATPVPPQQVIADVQKQVSELGLMTWDEYRELIVKPQMLRDRLKAQLAEAVPTSAEQVWARHILVDSEDEAKDVLARLQAGADFTALAQEVSKDTSNKEKGGDLGWFARGAMVEPFEEAAFKLEVGQTVTEPVETSFGYHIIQVLGHEQSRPLSDDQIKKAKDNALDDWLRVRRSEAEKEIEYDFSPARMSWASRWIAKNAKYLKAQR